MGLFSLCSKPSQRWQLFVIKTDGRGAKSPPSDRNGALAIVMSVMEIGGKLDHATYAGSPISQSALEDLVADAHLLNSLVELAEQKGLSLEAMMERGPDQPEVRAAMGETRRKIAEMLGITELYAAEVCLRRLGRGFVRIFEQQTP